MAFLISTFSLLYFPTYQGGQIYTRGPYAPWTPLSGDIFFLPKVSTSQYLIVFLISTFQLQQFRRFQGVRNLRQRALFPLCAPSGIFFVSEASTLLCLMAFLISAFQLFYFPRYQGISNLHQGAICPLDLPSGEIFVPKASTLLCLMAFSMGGRHHSDTHHSDSHHSDKCDNYRPIVCILEEPGAQVYMWLWLGLGLVTQVRVGIVSVGMVTCTRFQFQLSSSCIFRDIRGSQIYTWGPYAPCTPPSGEFFFTKSEYFTTFNCVFNFNILALVVSEILGGPKFTLGGPTPGRPLAENFFLPKASTSQYLIVFLISTFQLQQFPIFQGVPNLRQRAVCPPLRPLAEIFLYPRRVRQYV